MKAAIMPSNPLLQFGLSTRLSLNAALKAFYIPTAPGIVRGKEIPTPVSVFTLHLAEMTPQMPGAFLFHVTPVNRHCRKSILDIVWAILRRFHYWSGSMRLENS